MQGKNKGMGMNIDDGCACPWHSHVLRANFNKNLGSHVAGGGPL